MLIWTSAAPKSPVNEFYLPVFEYLFSQNIKKLMKIFGYEHLKFLSGTLEIYRCIRCIYPKLIPYAGNTI